METKVCTRCKQEKLLSEFRKDRRFEDRHGVWCGMCCREYAKKRYHKNPEARDYIAEHNKVYREVHKERYGKMSRAYNLRTKYGMTSENYEQMVEDQNGVCAICGKPETKKQCGKPQLLVVDHDHVTGKVRGLLCWHCNAKLGHLEDIDFVLKARFYLALHTD